MTYAQLEYSSIHMKLASAEFQRRWVNSSRVLDQVWTWTPTNGLLLFDSHPLVFLLEKYRKLLRSAPNISHKFGGHSLEFYLCINT